jgi:endonuclease/exonuclease/phosphatase family metal-dependent hydrolase
LGAIADLLRAEEVDVAVLNEVDFAALWSGHQDQAAFIAERGGFPYLATQRNLDVSLPGFRLRFGNAILSTFPIESAALVPYPPYSVTESLIAGSKQGMYTDLVVKPGKRMRVLAVHLENRDAATREAAAAEISRRARASPAPFFALGDFNAPRADHHVHQHGWLAPTAVDRLLESGLFQTRPVQAPRREELTWPSWAPNRAIDWILVPMEWTILSHRVVATDLSDHCLVIMEVRPRAGWE